MAFWNPSAEESPASVAHYPPIGALFHQQPYRQPSDFVSAPTAPRLVQHSSVHHGYCKGFVSEVISDRTLKHPQSSKRALSPTPPYRRETSDFERAQAFKQRQPNQDTPQVREGVVGTGISCRHSRRLQQHQHYSQAGQPARHIPQGNVARCNWNLVHETSQHRQDAAYLVHGVSQRSFSASDTSYTRSDSTVLALHPSRVQR